MRGKDGRRKGHRQRRGRFASDFDVVRLESITPFFHLGGVWVVARQTAVLAVGIEGI